MLRRGKVEKIGWKIFDFCFSSVRIEYLHENIQGKEVKNGKFKKRANCKKKISSEQL